MKGLFACCKPRKLEDVTSSVLIMPPTAKKPPLPLSIKVPVPIVREGSLVDPRQLLPETPIPHDVTEQSFSEDYTDDDLHHRQNRHRQNRHHEKQQQRQQEPVMAGGRDTAAVPNNDNKERTATTPASSPQIDYGVFVKEMKEKRAAVIQRKSFPPETSSNKISQKSKKNPGAARQSLPATTTRLSSSKAEVSSSSMAYPFNLVFRHRGGNKLDDKKVLNSPERMIHLAPSGEEPIKDVDDEMYMDYYRVWYQHGLLQWRPKGVELLPATTNMSLLLGADNKNQHGDDDEEEAGYGCLSTPKKKKERSSCCTSCGKELPKLKDDIVHCKACHETMYCSLFCRGQDRYRHAPRCAEICVRTRSGGGAGDSQTQTGEKAAVTTTTTRMPEYFLGGCFSPQLNPDSYHKSQSRSLRAPMVSLFGGGGCGQEDGNNNDVKRRLLVDMNQQKTPQDQDRSLPVDENGEALYEV